MYDFDWSVVWPHLWYLLEGVPTTLLIATSAAAIGLAVGLPLALLRLGGPRVVSFITVCYVELFRNTPVVVQIIWIFYALPAIVGISSPPLVAGIVALGINASAYSAELFRAGILALPTGQSEASRSLGMSYRESLVHVVLPQAVRKMIPPFVNNYVVLVKGSSLVAFIGVLEVLQRGNLAVVATGRPVEIYTTVAAIYMLLIIAVSRAAAFVEGRVAIVE